MHLTSSKARWQHVAEQLYDVNALVPFAKITSGALQGSRNAQKFDTPGKLPQLLQEHGLTPWRTTDNHFLLIPLEAAYVELPVPDQRYLLDGPARDNWKSGFNDDEQARWADLMELKCDGRSVRELFVGSRATRSASVPVSRFTGTADPYRCGPRHIVKHSGDARPDKHIMWEWWKVRRHALVEVKRENYPGERTEANTYQLFMPSWVTHSTGVFEGEHITPLLVILHDWGAGRFYRFAPVTEGRNKGRLDRLTIVESAWFQRRP